MKTVIRTSSGPISRYGVIPSLIRYQVQVRFSATGSGRGIAGVGGAADRSGVVTDIRPFPRYDVVGEGWIAKRRTEFPALLSGGAAISR
jgi:hypothetical protein